MEQLVKEIHLSYVDKRIDDIVSSGGRGVSPFTFHFTQNEDFFLKLSREYFVPSFKIHHDIRNLTPNEEYLDKLMSILDQITSLCPIIFENLTYYFDSAEIFRPCFYRVDSVNNQKYLYLLRLDLSYKPSIHKTLSNSDNDHSPAYSTDTLFVDSEFIPLENIERKNGVLSSFTVKQVVSNTWIGERGRGYSIQGIWMDRDLTKYLSYLFTPLEKKLYPYYPFTCKYKTIDLFVTHLSSHGRTLLLPLLHDILNFIVPHMDSIEQDLVNNDFSTDLESFQNLKKHVPSAWQSVWSSYVMKTYINEHNRKEWQLVFPYT